MLEATRRPAGTVFRDERVGVGGRVVTVPPVHTAVAVVRVALLRQVFQVVLEMVRLQGLTEGDLFRVADAWRAKNTSQLSVSDNNFATRRYEAWNFNFRAVPLKHRVNTTVILSLILFLH